MVIGKSLQRVLSNILERSHLLKNAILDRGEENIRYADRKKFRKAWVTEQMVDN